MRTSSVIRALVAAAIVVGCGAAELPTAEPVAVVPVPVPVSPPQVVAPVVTPEPPVAPPAPATPDVDHPDISAIYTDLRFERGEATLGKEWGDLSNIAAAIKGDGYALVEIHGYIERDEAAALAGARAESVKKRLVKAGVPAGLLCTVAHTSDPRMNLPQMEGGMRYVNFVGRMTATGCPSSL